MKKAVLFLSVFFCVAFTAAAQDTLHIRWPLPHYFSYVWPPSYYDSVDTLRTGITFSGMDKFATDYAYYMFTKDTLTIYGVAACLISEKDRYGSILFGNALDTSYRELYDYLRIYDAGNGEIIPLREVKAHMHVTPIAYYMDFDAFGYTGNTPQFMHPALPIYECYFPDPVDVIDSFYVGRHFHTYRTVDSNGYGQGYFVTTMAILHALTYTFFNDYTLVQPWASRERVVDEINDTVYYEWEYFNAPLYSYDWLRNIPIMFPILEPAPGSDTTIVGSDTTAMGDTLIVYDTVIVNGDTIIVTDTLLTVMQHDLLQRLTGVTPNPAMGTARVVASTGLTMVEAYSLAGRKVHTQRVPQGALSVTLDVSRWPAGTYLLRIHTPMGATIKKLTVAR